MKISICILLVLATTNVSSGQGSFLGITSQGGLYGGGTIFRTTGNGSGFVANRAIFSDADNWAYGGTPIGRPILINNSNFMIATNHGGTNNSGVLLEYNFELATAVVRYNFPINRFPIGELFRVGNLIYGLTTQGGSLGLYSYNITTGAVTHLPRSFQATTAGLENGGYFLATSDPNFGAAGWVVDGFTMGIITTFNFNNQDLRFPVGAMTRTASHRTFGFTKYGGPGVWGGIFELHPNGVAGDKKYFSSEVGENPRALDLGGKLYYMLKSGVLQSYDYNQDQIAYRGNVGGEPRGGLTLSPNGNLYGVTQTGGAQGYGSLFEFDPQTNNIVTKASFSADDGYFAGTGLLFVKESQLPVVNNVPVLTAGQTFTLVASGLSGLPIIYESTNPTVATVAGNILTATGPGSATLMVTIPGNDFYHPLGPLNTPFSTDGPPNNVICYTNPPNLICQGETFTITASSSAGLALTLEFLGLNENCTFENIGNDTYLVTLATALSTDQVNNVNWRFVSPGDLTHIPAQTPWMSTAVVRPPQFGIYTSYNYPLNFCDGDIPEGILLSHSSVNQIQWTRNGLPVGDPTYGSLAITQPGLYSAHTSYMGCSAEAYEPLIVTTEDCSAFVAFPNPIPFVNGGTGIQLPVLPRKFIYYDLLDMNLTTTYGWGYLDDDQLVTVVDTGQVPSGTQFILRVSFAKGIESRIWVKE